MYAIVDIETTGGNAQHSCITEIAIILHDGKSIEGRYSTLVNPQQPIPRYIQAITGIDNEMVASAPTFSKVAEKVFNLLDKRIFVAHNVNFDYSFIHHQLQQHGYFWQAKKVCSVRYARKIFKNLTSYSLGNLCRDLSIPISNRHRALGDAEATSILFDKLMANDIEHKVLNEFIKGKNAHSYLPMNVPLEQLENLPYCPGVYNFHNEKGQIIYIGKAVNLKFRIRSHFSNNSSNQRKQDFIREIFSISYTTCISEMHSIVLEALEIKKHWPKYNNSHKKFEREYGLYCITNRNGLMRFAIETKRKHLPAVTTFYVLQDGHDYISKTLKEFDIDYTLAMNTSTETLTQETIAGHNIKMEAFINKLSTRSAKFYITEKGQNEMGDNRTLAYFFENNRFYGLGFIDANAIDIDVQMPDLNLYNDNSFVRHLLLDFAATRPDDLINQNG